MLDYALVTNTLLWGTLNVTVATSLRPSWKGMIKAVLTRSLVLVNRKSRYTYGSRQWSQCQQQ